MWRVWCVRVPRLFFFGFLPNFSLCKMIAVGGLLFSACLNFELLKSGSGSSGPPPWTSHRKKIFPVPTKPDSVVFRYCPPLEPGGCFTVNPDTVPLPPNFSRCLGGRLLHRTRAPPGRVRRICDAQAGNMKGGMEEQQGRPMTVAPAHLWNCSVTSLPALGTVDLRSAGRL